MQKRFAVTYSTKVKDLAYLLRVGDDTQEREMKNLLVWAIPALIWSEDESATELHREHHSRTAGLHQSLAAAEKGEWDGLIERATREQQDEDESKNSNQLDDKAQACLKRVK